MPWGKHKGIPMKDVEHSYLLWLFKQPWIKDWPDLYDYLLKNQDALLMDERADEANNATDGFDSVEDYERYGR